jgi:hypothetical protein
MVGKRGTRGINVGFGFNLIGLLLVVVILGVSAAFAVSSLGGTTAGRTSGTISETTVGTTAGKIGAIANESAVVACESDASEVQTAIQEYSAEHGVPSADVTPVLLTAGPSPFLVSFPSNPSYTISIAAGVVMIAAPESSVPVAYGTPGACAKAGS